VTPSFRLTVGPLVPRPVHPARRAVTVWAVRLAILGAIVGPAIAFHHPILVAYARLFRVDDPAPSDAIVVLLGGPESRPARAAELYRAGVAPRVLFCTGTSPGAGLVGEWALIRHTLIAGGVPPSALVIVASPVTSTKQEAEAILPVARGEGMRRITVVTTSFHTARARWIFRRVFGPSGIEIRMGASTNPHYDESNWYLRDESVFMYAIETIKTIVYRLAY